MRSLAVLTLCCVGLAASAQLPAPKLYYPLDGTVPPVAGVMPVNGNGVFGPGMTGFGLAVTNSNNQLRAPAGFNEGAEPGTSDWTLSFWARFTWDGTISNFRLFSKGGRNNNASEAPGFQFFCRAAGTFSAFFSVSNATTREQIDANAVYTKFKNNQWNHFVFMRRGSAFRIYLNGEYIAQKDPLSGGSSGHYGVGPASLYRETQLSPESTVPNWGLDDVATWMSALTDTQVTDIYTQGTNGVPLSGLVSVTAYETQQDGTWEDAATWKAQPESLSAAFVKHTVSASTPLPTLHTLALSGDAALALGSGSALTLFKTGDDALRVGYADTATFALSAGAGLSVTGLAYVGAAAGGTGTLSADAATAFFSEGLRVGHMGGTGTAAFRNGAALTTRLSLHVGNEGGTGTLLADGATVNVTNDWLSVGRNGGTGTLILTNSAVLNKSGANSIEFGNRADGVSALVMDGSTLNVLNAASEFHIGKSGSRSTVSLTGSAVNMGSRMDFAHQNGAYVEALLKDSSIVKAGHDGTGLLFCEGGAATSLFTAVDSVLSITRSGGTGANAIQLAPSTGGVCVFTNINSVVEAVSTNGSRIYIAGGINARVTYVQDGPDARMTSPGDLRLGDGAGSLTDFSQLDGLVEADQYLRLAPSATATADYRLSGGTLSARGIIGGTGTGARLIFDGGTYKAATNTDAVLLDGKVDVLFAEGKQAAFDTAGRSLSILPYYAPQGSGGLAKKGAGTLRIPGSYTGPTTVEQGTLVLYNSASSSVYSIGENAALRFDGLTDTAVSAATLTLDGTLMFNANASGTSMARLNLTGATVSLGENAKIAFPSGMFLLPGKSFTFLETDDTALGALAQNAENIPSGWMVANDGVLYTLQEITPSTPPLGRDDVVVWLSRETIDALPLNTVAYEVGAFSGTGMIVSNALRNDLLQEVKAVYLTGAADQAMHGPAAPEGIVGNGTWSASMWVWSGNRANHEPTVVCWGMRKGSSRQNCSLNHASTEARAASFYGLDPKYSSGAPALDSWQHIVFSYSGATSGQGLSVYVNGEPRTLNLDVNTLIIPNDSQTILLGNQHDSQPQSIIARPYEGFIGELVIFDNTMSQTEAMQLYSNGVPVFVGSDALPDDDQVFETTDFDNWTDALGWRNENVPYNNSALVTGNGVSADVDSIVPSFKNLRVEDGAAVNVKGVNFRPGGMVTVSNSAAVTVSGGGLLDPEGHVYVASGSALSVSGASSKLFVQALNTPLRVGNETLAPSTLSISDGGEVEVRNNSLQIAYNTDAAPGNATLSLNNATLKIGVSSMGGNLFVGHQSGSAALSAVGSTITLVNGQMRVASSGNNGTARGDLLLDNTVLTLSGGLYLAFCETEMYYRSLNVVDAVIRNKSSVTVGGDFILGNRNAASDFNQPMTPNTPSVLVLDDATLTLNSWASIARQNGLGTLVITNNALVIKRNANHFRIGTDGNATANQGANTNPYTEGRVHVSAGGILDVQTATNELRIATAANDRGVLTLGDGGTVKAFTVTGNGTRGAFVFDGGTLQARASTNLFVNCAVPLHVTEGKQAVIDTQAFSVGIPRAFGGAGGLLKKGSGTLTLSALSTNTGPVTVEAGTLAIPAGCGVGGTLTVPAAGATVLLGASNVADTVSLGGLHLETDLPLDLTAPGICDTLVFTTTAGFTADANVGLTLRYDAGLHAALFGNRSVKYLIAQAPAGCENEPFVTDLPQGWFVAAQPSGETLNYILTSQQGTVLLMR